MESTTRLQMHNWEGSLLSHPKAVVKPQTAEEIVEIIGDRDRYPSPVRAVGSNHSTTRCAVADGGTVVDMTDMSKILHIGPDTVTTQGGALYIDVAHKLREHNLQFYVNVELGNLTMGSAACGGTKDASMPDEFGQVCSYAIGIKMITATGKLVEITEREPELLQVARSSYGLMGVVYEVTFRVKPHQLMAVRHGTYRLDEFEKALPDLTKRSESMMLYLFPFLNRVAVEYRRYHDVQGRPNSLLWRFRNRTWKSIAPGLGYIVTRFIPLKGLRYFIVDTFNRIMLAILRVFLRDRCTSPTDQIIRYADESNWTRYTFSIWAFPEETYAEKLRAYFEFCRTYYREHGYRCDLMNVGYRIAKDTSSLLSYSFDTKVMTLDPVSTGGPAWEKFLVAYNEFCSNNGGIPLFNQTKSITPAQARKAFGGRLDKLEQYRKRYDPENRLLNDYFREMLNA